LGIIPLTMDLSAEIMDLSAEIMDLSAEIMDLGAKVNRVSKYYLFLLQHLARRLKSVIFFDIL
jgi:hypothetical protein